MIERFSKNIIQWLMSPNTGDTIFAVSNAVAVLLFLWALKVYLAYWMRSRRKIDPLEAMSRAATPLLGAADAMMCLGLAATYWSALRFCRMVHGSPVSWLMLLMPPVLGGGVAVFSVLSLRINQIYGLPMNIDLLRSASKLQNMRDSIHANFDRVTIALLIVGISMATFGGRILEPAFATMWDGYRRVEIWLLVLVPSCVYGLLAILKLRGIYSYGLKQNAVLFFIRFYHRRTRAVNIEAILQRTPADARAADEGFRLATPIVPVDVARPAPVRAGAPSGDFNILFLLLESTPAHHVTHDTMPNLARLAQTGVLFDNHFTTSSETGKAIYSLFYSDHLTKLGGTLRDVYERSMPQPSLASAFRSRGYRTGFFHSGRLLYGDKVFLLDGFDDRFGAEILRQRGGPCWAWGVFEEEGVAATCEWIREQKSNQPFFAVYATTFPHHPYACPLKHKPFPTETWRDRFRNSLYYADRNIGRLIDSLKAEGLEENTIVVAVADHGETTATWPVGHGVSLCTEELRVPWIISNPKLLKPGSKFDVYTHHLDVAPTLLSLMNIPTPKEWLGRNLLADSIPRRSLHAELEQSKIGAIIDNGLLYEFDRKSGRDDLYEIRGDDLLRLAPDDARRHLLPAYRDRSRLYAPWVIWRHCLNAKSGLTQPPPITQLTGPLANGHAMS